MANKDNSKIISAKELEAVLERAKAEAWTDLAFFSDTFWMGVAKLSFRYVFNLDGPFEIPMARLCRLKNLKSLFLQGKKIGDQGAEAIAANLGNLSRLDMLDCQVGEAGGVAIGKNLLNLKYLNLTGNQVEELGGVAIGKNLVKLEKLDLSGNQVGEAGWVAIGKNLVNLKNLDLSGNQVGEAGGVAIGKNLVNLEFLNLSGNQVGEAGGVAIGKNLVNLEFLNLSGNQVGEAGGVAIGKNLVNLEFLNLSGNQVGEAGGVAIGTNLKKVNHLNLPGNQVGDKGAKAIATNLTKLRWINLSRNQLERVPRELGELPRLLRLDLSHNERLPFSWELLEEMDSATKQEFIRTWERDQFDRFEAKLMIIGFGKVGKTCLSRALRDLDFEHQKQGTTGVDIADWDTKKTGASKKINFKIWDFEGQEIHHQTHQHFFMTHQSLYLLTVNGRSHLNHTQIQDLLDSVYQRAPNTRVLIVATECEDNEPEFDAGVIHERARSLLPGEHFFFRVGCKNKKGIKELRARIVELAFELGIVPQKWHRRYQAVERAIEARRKDQVPIMTYQDLKALVLENKFSESQVEVVVRMMAEMGVLTHFRNAAGFDLKNALVLKPQWLTKAISVALDAPELVESQGVMEREVFDDKWNRDPVFRNHHHFFFQCMRQFHLCYPSSNDQIDLVPLRFPARRPQHIPWRLQTETARQRTLEYRFLEITPPSGLMGRFIVQTHHWIDPGEERRGLFWRNGTFLRRTDPWGDVQEALCEYSQEGRWLRITARGNYPLTFIQALEPYARELFQFFRQLKPAVERYISCIREDGSPCPGFHSVDDVIDLEKDNLPVRCRKGKHRVAPETLLRGVVRDLQDSEILVRLRALEQKGTRDKEEILNMLFNLAQSIDRESHETIPKYFTLTPADGFKWKNLTKLRLKVTFYCEGNPHHLWDYEKVLAFDKSWVVRAAPWLRTALSILKFVVPGINLLDSQAGDPLDAQLQPMGELVKTIDSMEVETPHSLDAMHDYAHPEMEGYRQLRHAIANKLKQEDLAAYENRDFDGLQRITQGVTRKWLCPNCQGSDHP